MTVATWSLCAHGSCLDWYREWWYYLMADLISPSLRVPSVCRSHSTRSRACLSCGRPGSVGPLPSSGGGGPVAASRGSATICSAGAGSRRCSHTRLQRYSARRYRSVTERLGSQVGSGQDYRILRIVNCVNMLSSCMVSYRQC